MNKQIDYYLSLPYTIEIIPEPQGDWFVGIKELPGCMTNVDTPEEGLAEIQQIKREWLEIALEDGLEIPEPRTEEEYSGNFRLRVPRSLHRKLVEEAAQEGVSLNAVCNAFLAEAVGYHKADQVSVKRGVTTRAEITKKDVWEKFCLAIGAEEMGDQPVEEFVANWLNSEFENAFQSYLAGKPREAIGELFYMSKLLTARGRS